jgi:predicted RNA-binding Zn ribbon-like protein
LGDIARIERIAGHPAIDFVNTLGGLPGAADDEYLFSYTDLLTWTQGAGLLQPDEVASLHRVAQHEPEQAAETFRSALRLRQHLDAVLRAYLADEAAAAADLEALRDAEVRALIHAALRPSDGAYTWTWPPQVAPSALDQPLWTLAHHGIDLLRSDALERLTRCGHCRWVFLDSSRNRSRRWCSMKACGAVMKMRRYRSNQRT